MSTSTTPRSKGSIPMGVGLSLGLGGQAGHARGQGQTKSQPSSLLNLNNNMLPKPITGGERGAFRSSDDHSLIQKMREDHAPDGTRFDVTPILHLAQDILTNVTQTIKTADPTADHAKATAQVGKQKQRLFLFKNMPHLPNIIERLSCEMSCKCSGGTDARDATLSILNILSRFNWEAKLALILAAFALSYGEFWLLVQIHANNPLAESMALLKQIPTIMEHSEHSLKEQFEAISILIKAMLDLIKMAFDYIELRPESKSQLAEAALKQFQRAVYYAIRSSVSAATQITVLTSGGDEYTPSVNELELPDWTNNLTVICENFGKQIDQMKENEAYYNIRKTVFSMKHSDNMPVLEVLIQGKDDTLLLCDGSTSNKQSARIDILRGKTVLLLISSLHIPIEHLSVLLNIRKELCETHQCEIIWAPIVDRTVSWNDHGLTDKFEAIPPENIAWYFVQDPSIIRDAVIRFFREDLKFKGEPTLVALDPQGTIINFNALPMMWIWGSEAYPFTDEREKSLWKNESWDLNLLLGKNIDQTVKTWIDDGKYIFFFGGDDFEGIKIFIEAARSVESSSEIIANRLELLYVGKSCKKEKGIQNIISKIENEKLCTVLDTSKIRFFWTRLHCMLHSKIQSVGKNADVADTISVEISKLIGYDETTFGMWALLAEGRKVVVSGHGSTIRTALKEFDRWSTKVGEIGFADAFHNHHQSIYRDYIPCFRFHFPSRSEMIQDCMICPHCHNTMQSYTTLLCCHEGAAATAATSLITANASVEIQTATDVRGASEN